MAQELPSKITQDRSPRFPSGTLQESIEHIAKIYAGLGRAPAPAEALVKAVGYQALSGTARTVLACLSYYGLTMREGNNHRVSELALRIIRPTSEGDKAKAISQAAFEPALFAQLHEEHAETSEDLLGTLLIHRGFTEDGSKKAARVFKENLAYIAQFRQGVVEKETPVTPLLPASTPAVAAYPGPNVSQPPKSQMITHAIAANELPVPIGDNLIARVPFPMTEEDFDLFIGTLTLWKKKLIGGAARSLRREATWRNKDTDLPVIVIGEMVAPDGRHFYRIEGSNTGVPVDEVRFN
jgi:hypothetical protein